MTDHQTAQRLLAMEDVLILTHRRPDGDTIGCACALCLALRQLGKTAWVLPNEDAHGLFTPYFEGVLAPAEFVPQFVVSVDTAALGMLPGSGKAYADRIDLAIDHHPSQEFFARETCLEADSAACGEIVYDILRQLTPLTPEMALPLYVAISTDTGCFVYSNTTPDTHRIAAALMPELSTITPEAIHITGMRVTFKDVNPGKQEARRGTKKPSEPEESAVAVLTGSVAGDMLQRESQLAEFLSQLEHSPMVLSLVVEKQQTDTEILSFVATLRLV